MNIFSQPLPHSFSLLSRDRPFLLFFDLTRCVRKLDFTAIASGNFEASDLFSCPTQQVKQSRQTLLVLLLCLTSLSRSLLNQVCVSQCPTVNEIGVRANPVCVEGVNTTQFNVLAANDSITQCYRESSSCYCKL